VYQQLERKILFAIDNDTVQKVQKIFVEENITFKTMDDVARSDLEVILHGFKPTDVVIDLLWSLPRIEELIKKYCKIRWVIRVDSLQEFADNREVFLSIVRMKNGYIFVNNAKLVNEIAGRLPFVKGYKILHLPDFYCHINDIKHCEKIADKLLIHMPLKIGNLFGWNNLFLYKYNELTKSLWLNEFRGTH
jgi:hypothetical protein